MAKNIESLNHLGFPSTAFHVDKGEAEKGEPVNHFAHPAYCNGQVFVFECVPYIGAVEGDGDYFYHQVYAAVAGAYYSIYPHGSYGHGY